MTASASHPALPAFAVFAGFLAAAGIPIYIFAPTFYAQNYGTGLTAIAAVLFWLRLLDAVQDPLFGWMSERLGRDRRFWIGFAVFILIGSLILLFAIPPRTAPLLWFALSMTGLFSAFSFLTINFYAQGISAASHLPGGHMQLAAWRETGGLIGICLAAVAPTLLMLWSASPMVDFTLGFAGCGLLASWMMRHQWGGAAPRAPSNFAVIWQDHLARRLLILAFVNAMPVAVTSTLFLFFVTHRLQAGAWAGGLLLVFFLSAAGSAPVWAKAAQRFGTRQSLIWAMSLAVVVFALAAFLRSGDVAYFALVCIASGASIGADLTLLPAAFAQRLSIIAPRGGQGFGLWALMSKLTLAAAAIAVFPILDGAGFDATAQGQTAQALWTLTLLYAVCPLILKLVAIGLLIKTPLQDEQI
ncbi:MFS transporter [bacterium]|nr:MFS transporter [bacterium]